MSSTRRKLARVSCPRCQALRKFGRAVARDIQPHPRHLTASGAPFFVVGVLCESVVFPKGVKA